MARSPATCCRRRAKTTCRNADIPVRPGPRDHDRRCAGAGAAHRVRRRTRLGTAHPNRVRRARVRAAAKPRVSHTASSMSATVPIDTLRMEKGYLYWSTDITPDTTPWEAGLGWRVDLDKGRRSAVARRWSAGDGNQRRRLCTFTLEAMAYPVERRGDHSRRCGRRVHHERQLRPHRWASRSPTATSLGLADAAGLLDRGLWRTDPGDTPRRSAVRPEQCEAEIVNEVATALARVPFLSDIDPSSDGRDSAASPTATTSSSPPILCILWATCPPQRCKERHSGLWFGFRGTGQRSTSIGQTRRSQRRRHQRPG